MKLLPIILEIDLLYNEKVSLKEQLRKINVIIDNTKSGIIRNEIFNDLKFSSAKEYIPQSTFYESLGKKKNIIDKIETIRKRISSLCRFYVSWSIVKFHKGFIEIIFEDFGSVKVNCLKSRESFNLIKINILKKMIPFKAIWIRKDRRLIIPKKVDLNNVLLYLSIKEELSNVISPSFNAILFFSTSIKNQKAFLRPFFDKSLYLEYWSNRQSENYKIIPVIEKRWNGSSYDCEDAFLFTIELDSSIVIVWENTNNERATYLFSSSSNTYFEDIQTIFDYVSSSNKHKRKSLRYKLGVKEILYTYKSIYHVDYDLWRNGIEKMLGRQPLE